MNAMKKQRKSIRVPALVIAAALGLSAPAYGDEYPVTVANDNGTGDTPNTLSWESLGHLSRLSRDLEFSCHPI